MKKTLLAGVFLGLLFSLQLHAQCPTENTAFKAGERLTYDLYFNWKFIPRTLPSKPVNASPTTFISIGNSFG